MLLTSVKVSKSITNSPEATNSTGFCINFSERLVN